MSLDLKPASRTSCEFDELRALRSQEAFDITEAARDVVVIAMSARSGSSWLIELLKRSRDAIHLRGEVTTLLRLHGLSYPASGPSEFLDESAIDRVPAEFRTDLSFEAGWPAEQPKDPNSFCIEILWRLRLQWPQVSFSSDTLAIIRAEFDTANIGGKFAADRFTHSMICRLSRTLPIDPHYYDLGLVPSESKSDLPWDCMLESPPFILFAPWNPAARSDFGRRPLILKSAGDVYRLSFYRKLFRNARFRVIHLRRNPAASINGLLDGWLSQKYQSFRVPGLAIKGYSDGDQEWRKHWWKFDLGPGWEKLRGVPLVDVCAWQWASAQREVLRWLDATKCDHATVCYEDLIHSPESRRDTIAGLCKWIGIGEVPAEESRNVNASVPPSAYRWKKRESEILGALHRGRCLPLAQSLGYSSEPAEWP
jgi:hypothetical protein